MLARAATIARRRPSRPCPLSGIVVLPRPPSQDQANSCRASTELPASRTSAANVWRCRPHLYLAWLTAAGTILRPFRCRERAKSALPAAYAEDAPRRHNLSYGVTVSSNQKPPIAHQTPHRAGRKIRCSNRVRTWKLRSWNATYPGVGNVHRASLYGASHERNSVYSSL